MNSDFIQSVGQLRSPVATYSDLIALVDDNVVGDMRIVLDTGDAYVWSGSISPITHTQWFKATTSYYNDLHGSPSLSGLDIDNAVKMVPSLAANVALLAYNMIVTGMESITRLFDGMVNKFLDEVGINTAASTNELYTSNEYYKPDLSSAPTPVSSVIEDSSGLEHVIDVHGGAVASGANPLIGNASLVLDGIDSYLSSPSTAEMVPGTIDAYTKLLLHLDNNLTDSATGKIVGDGGVTFSSSVKKFGSHALSFNGSSYIAVPYSTDFNFTDQPFTIDLWANFNTSSPASYLVGQNNQGTLAADFDAIGGLLYIYVRDAAGLRIYMSADFTPTPGVWYHLALVRIDNGNSANSWRIFINGISQTLTLRGGSWNASYPNHTTPLLIGSEIDGYFHNGYMDEIRISKGIARWTENFTPSSTAYPLDVLSDSDWKLSSGMNDANTKILLHCDGGFTDECGNTINVSGSTIVSSPNKFGTGAGQSWEDLVYVSTGDLASTRFGTGNFTLEGWFRCVPGINTGEFRPHLAIQRADTGLDFAVGRTAGGSHRLEVQGSKMVTSGLTPSGNFTQGGWNHLAAVREGNSINIYLDGIKVATYDCTGANFTQGNITIGGAANAYSLAGQFDEIRVSNVARYTANFIPATAPFTLSTLSDYTVDFWINPKSLEDLNTYLIGVEDSWKLTLDGVMTASSIVDETGKTVTNNGVTLSTDVKKIGNASMSFNGSSFLSVPDSDDFNFGLGDFTIDCWFKLNVELGDIVLYSQLGGGEVVDIELYRNGATDFLFFPNNSGGTVHASLGTTLSINTWYHFAIVKIGNIVKVFLNGVQVISDSTMTAAMPDIANPIFIGRRMDGMYPLNGSIDEFRVSKGIARWTTNFTPSTVPYTVDANTKLLLHGDATISKYLKYSVVGGNSMVAPIALALDTWQHLAVVQNAGTAKLYVNGVLGASMVGSETPNSATALSIGGSSTGTHLVDGLMEEVRISKGIARWVAPFTPEAIAYTTDANTTLLLDFNVETVSNMVLKSEGFISNYVPTSARVVIFEEDVDTLLANIDMKMEVSRDGGTTFSLATLTKGQDFGNGTLNLFTGEADLAAQPNGNVIVYRLTTMNNKDCKIKGVSLTWR